MYQEEYESGVETDELPEMDHFGDAVSRFINDQPTYLNSGVAKSPQAFEATQVEETKKQPSPVKKNN